MIDYILYKHPFEWTNEDKDYIEDNYLCNPQAEVHRRLRQKHIPVSYNYKFYKNKRHIWHLLGISPEGLHPMH